MRWNKLLAVIAGVFVGAILAVGVPGEAQLMRRGGPLPPAPKLGTFAFSGNNIYTTGAGTTTYAGANGANSNPKLQIGDGANSIILFYNTGNFVTLDGDVRGFTANNAFRLIESSNSFRLNLNGVTDQLVCASGAGRAACTFGTLELRRTGGNEGALSVFDTADTLAVQILGGGGGAGVLRFTTSAGSATGMQLFRNGADDLRLQNKTPTTDSAEVQLLTSGIYLRYANGDDYLQLGDGVGVFNLNAQDRFRVNATETKQKNHAAFAGSEAVTVTAAVQTTDATVTTLVDGTFELADNTAYSFRCEVIGREGATHRAAYGIMGLFYRQGGGLATQQGTTQTLHTAIETNAGLDATYAVSGNNLLLQVTGLAATTINWTATCNYQGVSTNS